MTTRTITFDDEQWQVVPKEATMYQVAVGATHSSSGDHMVARGQAIAIYDAMLAAAPEPQVCFCDEKGIGDPAKSCGDCPRDYGMPTVRANPEPPAQQPTDEHTDMLRDLLASYGNSGFSAERAALTAAIEALEPPAQQPTEIEEAISAGDGTLHGAIDHWQSRALAAEAMLRDCAEALRALLSYTKACEELLNVMPAGQIHIAEEALAKLNGESDED